LEATEEINSKGVGLGLYICKKIVTKFGGKVSVESEINKGSTFHYSFMLSEKILNDGGMNINVNPNFKTFKKPKIIVTQNAIIKL